MAHDGRSLTLSALAGAPSERVPAGVLTWGFEYYWNVAGLEPWQLACGSNADWERAHRALFDRHHPDFIFYSGSGSGDEPAELLAEDHEHWLARDGNTDRVTRIIKSSLTEIDDATGKKPNDPVGVIESEADAVTLIAEFTGWGDAYLDGLSKSIDYCGGRATPA